MRCKLKKINIKTGSQKLPNNPDKWVGITPYKRLTIDIPVDTHTKFKARTAENNEKMANVILKMINEYINKTSKQ